jgi:hypothetical protein
MGYVLAKDLALYANAFCWPLPRLSYTQQTVLDAVAHQAATPPTSTVEFARETARYLKALATFER